MKKHKILLVVRWPIGGIRTFFRYFYNNLDQERYRFTFIAPELPEIHVLLDELSTIDLRYISIPPDINSVGLLQAVTRVIRTEKFDLIHSHGLTAGVCSILGSLLRWTPHIMTLHETFTEKQFIGAYGLLKRIALSILLLTINSIHCVSLDAKDNLLFYFKILRSFRNKVTVILNGIEVEVFTSANARDFRKELGLSQNHFLIGFLGRFMPAKGFRYLVEALELVENRDHLPKQPIIISVNDEGAYIREEKENIKKRCLTESVLFLPFVPNVASTLKGLDVIVMPSLWEACGLLAMEAMVAGVPLIGTNCVGLREVLNNTPATAVPVADSLALADALIAEMNNPTTARAREFAAEAAVRFEVKRRAAELEVLMLGHIER